MTNFEKGINRYYRESLSGNAAREELFIRRNVYQEVTEDPLLFCPGEEDSLYFILEKEGDNGNRKYFILQCGSKGEELLRKEITEELTDDASPTPL